MLATVGAGVDVYFASGDLMLTPDTTDVLSAQIQGILTLIIQSILHCTVAPAILDKFETDAAVGFDLLVLIRRRYSHISVRELSNLVDSAVDARNKGTSPGEALAIFKNVCYQFNNTPEINQMMGLFYLKMFNSPLAKAKVLDCAAPDLSLSAVEVALEDFSPTVPQTFMVKNNKNKFKRNFKRTPNEITCLRCQVPGVIMLEIVLLLLLLLHLMLRNKVDQHSLLPLQMVLHGWLQMLRCLCQKNVC